MLNTQSPLPSLTSVESDDHLIRLWLGTVAPGSGRVYESVIREFRAAVRLPLREVRLEDLTHWFGSLRGAVNTKRRKQTTVKSLLSFAHRVGYLPFNVGGALAVRGMAQIPARRILSRAELWKVIESVTGRGREVLEFLYESGVRAGELAELRWRDLQPYLDSLGLATVHGKGGRTRNIIVSAEMFAKLTDRRGAAEDYVFSGPRGGKLEQPDLWRLVRRAVRQAGLESAVSPHWFRHACASHAIDAGAPLHLVQQQLGHSSLAVTGMYLHARPKDGLYRYLGPQVSKGTQSGASEEQRIVARAPAEPDGSVF